MIRIKQRKLVCGVGINDYCESCNIGNKHLKSYSVWKDMISRCYMPQKNRLEWLECSVCDEWLLFSNFKKWFDEHYVDGYSIDKDILVKNNKIYSPDTCCYVPKYINSLLASENNRGVYQCKRSKKYIAQLSKYHHHYRLGCFVTFEEANIKYVEEKNKHINEVANKAYLNSEISYNILNSLIDRYV